MKRKCLLVLLGLLALALAAAPALAASVSFDATHTFTVTFFTQATNATPSLIGSGQGTVNASSSDGGGSFYVDTGNPAGGNITQDPFYVPTPYLTNVSASTSSSGGSNAGISQNLAAIAPDNLGSINMGAYNAASFAVTATATFGGEVVVGITDAYIQHFALANSGTNYFSSLQAFSDLTLTLTDATTGKEGIFSTGSTPQNFLFYDVDNLGNPLPNANQTLSDSMLFLIGLTGITAGDSITLDITLNTTLSGGATNGVNPIPLPPSVLLLGSGLSGLFLVRRWKRQPDRG